MTHRLGPRVVIISGDTDVMVLALYFHTDLKTNGLSELWMRAGVGDSTRYIPLHLISERKPELFSVLPAIHILTGCYTTSKVGTKLSALKPPAAQLLSEFGKSLSSPNQDEVIRKSVQYLVQVLKPNSACIFLGMKCTTEVKSVISIPYHLPVLINICTCWGACKHSLYIDALSSKRNRRPN